MVLINFMFSDGLYITDVDDCVSDPCTHGVCSDAVNGYTCSCDAGYTGTSCDQGMF